MNTEFKILFDGDNWIVMQSDGVGQPWPAFYADTFENAMKYIVGWVGLALISVSVEQP